MDQQLVAIPAQSRAEGPMAHLHQILGEHRSFESHAPLRELKLRWHVWLEVARVADLIPEILVNRGPDGLSTCLHFVDTVMRGERAANVRLAKAAALIRQNRSRERIRPQVGGEISDHGPDAREQPGGQGVLVGNLPGCFFAAAVLALAGVILHQFIGHQKVPVRRLVTATLKRLLSFQLVANRALAPPPVALFVKFSTTGGSRYRPVWAESTLTPATVAPRAYCAETSPLAVEKLPPSNIAEPCQPAVVFSVVVTSMTPPSFRPYSAGYPAVRTFIDWMSSASSPGANPGERLSTSGNPSITYCVLYSAPRGCSTPLASTNQPGWDSTRSIRARAGVEAGRSFKVSCPM